LPALLANQPPDMPRMYGDFDGCYGLPYVRRRPNLNNNNAKIPGIYTNCGRLSVLPGRSTINTSSLVLGARNVNASMLARVSALHRTVPNRRVSALAQAQRPARKGYAFLGMLAEACRTKRIPKDVPYLCSPTISSGARPMQARQDRTTRFCRRRELPRLPPSHCLTINHLTNVGIRLASSPSMMC
jgi:hypothetical protein